MRTVVMLRALGDYGRLIIWPSKLYMERTVLDPESYLNTHRWAESVATEYLSAIGLIVLVAMIYGASAKARHVHFDASAYSGSPPGSCPFQILST